MSNKRTKVSTSTADDELVNIVGSKTSKQQLGVRAYLDQTVVPVLLQAMTALVKARPEDEDPAVFLANWILENQKKNPIKSIPKEDNTSSKNKRAKQDEEEVDEAEEEANESFSPAAIASKEEEDVPDKEEA